MMIEYTPKQHILIVDDTLKNIQLVASILKPMGYGLLFATDGEEALDVVKKNPVDLILLDVMMPKMDGFETCAHLKSSSKTKDIPVIFLTAKADIDSMVEGFNLGGVDYITKPFHEAELLARVKTHLKIAWMTEMLKDQADQMYQIAHTDPLTGIANRLKFDTILEHEIEVCKRYNGELGLIIFDIDHFKKINDTYTHKVGDMILVELAGLVQQTIRASDVFARWGGEEFTIILPKITYEKSVAIAEKLRYVIEKYEFSEVGQVTCSFGVTLLSKEDDEESIMMRADKALYQAKADGRNRVVVVA